MTAVCVDDDNIALYELLGIVDVWTAIHLLQSPPADGETVSITGLKAKSKASTHIVARFP